MGLALVTCDGMKSYQFMFSRKKRRYPGRRLQTQGVLIMRYSGEPISVVLECLMLE